MLLMQPAVGFSETVAAGGAAEPAAGEVAVPTAGEGAEDCEDGEDGEYGDDDADGVGNGDDGSVRYLLEQVIQNQQHLRSIRYQYVQLIQDATRQMTRIETRIAACYCAVGEVHQAWNMLQSGGDDVGDGVGDGGGESVGPAAPDAEAN
jgi:hypothetical protein